MRRRNAAHGRAAEPNPCRSSLAADELAAVEEFRYQARMPSRSACGSRTSKTGGWLGASRGRRPNAPFREAPNADGGSGPEKEGATGTRFSRLSSISISSRAVRARGANLSLRLDVRIFRVSRMMRSMGDSEIEQYKKWPGSVANRRPKLSPTLRLKRPVSKSSRASGRELAKTLGVGLMTRDSDHDLKYTVIGK